MFYGGGLLGPSGPRPSRALAMAPRLAAMIPPMISCLFQEALATRFVRGCFLFFQMEQVVRVRAWAQMNRIVDRSLSERRTNAEPSSRGCGGDQTGGLGWCAPDVNAVNAEDLDGAVIRRFAPYVRNRYA